MMKRGWMVMVGALGLAQAHAANIIDVYGVSPKESTVILKKYGQRIAQILVPLNAEVIKLKPDGPIPDIIEQLALQREALYQEMKKKERLVYVDFEEIVYPNKNDHFITIDVVKEGDQGRLHFVSQQTDKPQTYPKTNDIIDKMSAYNELAFQRMFSGQWGDGACPVYHCVYGFSDPEFKPYLALFNQAAISQKKHIIETLYHDKNPVRRQSAAFLVGHFTHPREIISTLMPCLHDPDAVVRNNAIRVIATTLQKTKIKDVDPRPFITLLDSPILTDRNKSLHVLLSIADSYASKKVMIEQAREPLLALLQLKQPDNHNEAYRLLKKLSGHDYGEYDLKAWRGWFKKAQSRSV